jgi:hypothetical protein
MYIFSANGKAKKAHDGIAEGQVMPFIVYVNFIDLFGAEQLCKVYNGVRKIFKSHLKMDAGEAQWSW